MGLDDSPKPAKKTAKKTDDDDRGKVRNINYTTHLFGVSKCYEVTDQNLRPALRNAHCACLGTIFPNF